ncbi:SDR family oxidoreductase [Elizabethkingia anophelis]|uniref:SDR family oxidoreductase n=1 Tax=Elizabethkingia anophelis TaxID=1117645 RepID=UPI00378703BF
MNRKFESKVAVITGGNSGIGYATAKMLKDKGASVVITGRRRDAVESAASEIECDSFVADQSILSDTDKLVTMVGKKYGKVDVLVINAGFGRYIPLEQTTEEQFDEIMNVNFKGAYFVLNKFIPILNDGASVIFISSLTASISMLNTSVYASSKAAVNTLIRIAARELAERKIRVNAVSPGVTDTALFSKTISDPDALNGLMENLKSQIPLKRLGTSDEVASLVLHLAGEEGAFITGSEFLIDGGSRLQPLN